MRNLRKKRVVITGVGPIGSVGIGKDAFWQGIINKNINVKLTQRKVAKQVWESFFLHRVADFNIKDFDIDKNDLNYIKNWKDGENNIDLLYLLAAVKLALDDSRIDYRSNKGGVGLIASHENPCMEQLLDKAFISSYALLRDNPKIDQIDFYNQLYTEIVKLGYESQAFMPLFHIARTFNIHEYSLFINNACASGLYAMEAASDMIQLGKARQVIVVAGDSPGVYKHLWFRMIKMYSEDGRIRPFAKAPTGIVMGEGATALILEDYESARRRKAFIYGEYLGGGFKLEGWGVTSPMIGGPYQEEVIAAALRMSGIKKEEIDVICAHGVGVKASDYYEASAIKNIFGKMAVPVTGFKPYVGHNLGGSNLIELAILLLGMKKGVIPPVLNTDEATDGLDLVLSSRRGKIKFALKSCAAFAGYNAAVVVKNLNA